MRRANLGLWITIIIITMGVVIMVYFKATKKGLAPKKLIAKSSFGKQGKELGEFNTPVGLAIKENYLYLADSGNNRIQILKINLDGSLVPQSTFDFPKEESKFFRFFAIGLDIRENFLYIADPNNNCIQILKINPDGSLVFYSAFGKEGAGLGKLNTPLGLAVKDNFIYVVDSGNSRIQVLEIE